MENRSVILREALNEIALDGDVVNELLLSSWFGEVITTKDGKKYRTIHNLIQYGLPTVRIPVVNGSTDSYKHPALRSSLLQGNWRANVYNIDHSGRVVNTESDKQEKDRRSHSSDLTTGLRFPCHIHQDGSCFVNPSNGLTTCGIVWDASTTPRLTGDIAKSLHQAVNTGLHMSKKTHILSIDYNGRVYIGKTKTLRVNSGAGKTGGFKDFATRYVSTCSDCGRKSCKANDKNKPCGDKPMLYTLVWSNESGLCQVGIDERLDNSDDIIEKLSMSVDGKENLVIRRVPFSHLGVTE